MGGINTHWKNMDLIKMLFIKSIKNIWINMVLEFQKNWNVRHPMIFLKSVYKFQIYLTRNLTAFTNISIWYKVYTILQD